MFIYLFLCKRFLGACFFLLFLAIQSLHINYQLLPNKTKEIISLSNNVSFDCLQCTTMVLSKYKICVCSTDKKFFYERVTCGMISFYILQIKTHGISESYCYCSLYFTVWCIVEICCYFSSSFFGNFHRPSFQLVFAF